MRLARRYSLLRPNGERFPSPERDHPTWPASSATGGSPSFLSGPAQLRRGNPTANAGDLDAGVSGLTPQPIFPLRPWQRERATLLYRILRKAWRLRAERPISATMRAAAKRVRGRKWRDGRVARLSAQSLRRLYYRWLADGDDALTLKFRGGKPRLGRQIVEQFLAVCAAEDSYSMAGAHRRFAATWPEGSQAPRLGRILRAMSNRERREIARFARVHRAVRRARRAIESATEL